MLYPTIIGFSAYCVGAMYTLRKFCGHSTKTDSVLIATHRTFG